MRGAAALLALLLVQETEETLPQFEERVEVARVVMDVRIVDAKGAPLVGLAAGDVRASVDGKPARIESLRWVSGTTPYAEGLTPESAQSAGIPAAPAGRLIVFFFQKELTEASRVSGLMRMKTAAAKLLDSLEPGNRVAVVSFDTRLKLWSDFSADRAALKRLIQHSILFEDEPRTVARGEPSLLPNWDAAAARRAASPEAAFAVVGRALEGVPGSKSLAFFGWGIGVLSGGSLTMRPEFNDAQRALARARVVVFSLDITDADYHTLEDGLRDLSEATGGFYVKTHIFPSLAMSRLERALEGYYSLSIEKPLLPPGRHELKLELVAKKGNVLTTATYVD